MAAKSLQKKEVIHLANIAIEGDAKLQEFQLDLLKHDTVQLDKQQQNSPRSLWSQSLFPPSVRTLASVSTQTGKKATQPSSSWY